MPYKISKLKNNKFQVKNTKTNEIKAKGTTKIKAEKQVKLLTYLENKQKGGNLITNVRNVARNVVCPKATRPLFPLESHFVCANFMGPATNIQARLARGDEGVNGADRAAKAHDIDYYNIAEKLKSGQITKEEAGRLGREADNKFINQINKTRSQDKSLYDKISSFAGKQIIGAKKMLEDIKVLDKTKFITGSGARKKKK